MFESLGAARDLVETQKAARSCQAEASDPLSSIDADDAIVRRLVDAAAFPELLGHETAAAIRDTLDADCAMVFVAPPDGELGSWRGRAAMRSARGPSHYAPLGARTAPAG